MDNHPISIYDPARFDKDIPANMRGGQSRADTARRDKWGRMLPEVGELPAPDCHGRAGGKALVKKYGKDYMRQLAKRRIKAQKENKQ